MIELLGEKEVRIADEDGCTRVYVGGKEIRRVREVSFHQSVTEMPYVRLNLYSSPEIEMKALVDVTYSEDEYIKWLDRMVEEADKDDKSAYQMCRARYLSYFGRPKEETIGVTAFERNDMKGEER